MKPENDSNYIKIIESVSATAAYQVDGVASLSNEAGTVIERSAYSSKGTNSVTAYFKNDKVVIDVYLNAYHTVSVPKLAVAIQQKVTEEVEKATTFKVGKVNIHVVGVVFPA